MGETWRETARWSADGPRGELLEVWIEHGSGPDLDVWTVCARVGGWGQHTDRTKASGEAEAYALHDAARRQLLDRYGMEENRPD